MAIQHGRRIIQVTLVVFLLVTGCSSALKHEKQAKMKQTEEKQKDDATSKIKAAGHLQWLGKNHKVFRDTQGDIVTSIHNQLPVKRGQRLTKRTKTPRKKGKSIHWLDKGHKIFKDGQNDIVISLHHQLATKKDKQPVEEARQPVKKDRQPVKEHKQPVKEVPGSHIKWLGKSKKVFQDSHYDIVTSIHNQRGVKKSQKDVNVFDRPGHQKVRGVEAKRSEIAAAPYAAKGNQERDASGSGQSGTSPSK